ncbi:MAG: hypothetical protein HY040_13680 [Planctomycetes bacterium]|nr:hypothetical protein [Planctomycetota bacterium]
MKVAIALVGVAALGLLLGQASSQAGDKKKSDDKVHEVTGGTLTIKGKLTEEIKDVPYKVKLEKGKTYTIHMHLGEPGLDAYLYLKDSGGKLLAEDDDSGGGDTNQDAEIVFECKTSATYQIIASSYEKMGTGEYTLKVTEKK